jgi:hypothetical protein
VDWAFSLALMLSTKENESFLQHAFKSVLVACPASGEDADKNLDYQHVVHVSVNFHANLPHNFHRILPHPLCKPVWLTVWISSWFSPSWVASAAPNYS